MSAVHKLNAAAPDAMTRSTYCRRESNGGGIVVDGRGPVLRFSSERGDFLGSTNDGFVTCKRCLR